MTSAAAQDIWHELDAAGQLPFGLERSALIESLVAQADHVGDEKLAVTSRLQLMTSYSYGGEPLRRFPVFAWLLDRFAVTPQLFDEADRYRLLWMFKWVTVSVTHHPAVARHRIEARLEEMAEHYAAAGEGLAPVLGCRYQVIAQMDGYPAAEEAYLAWVAAPRTALSDCEACEPAIRVEHLAATGRPADALAEAEPLLRAGGCADQPQRTIGHALEPLLQCGFGERAGYEHLRGVRLLRSAGGSPTTWAQHIVACAQGGQLRRGLDLLEDRLPELTSATTPWDGMWLSAAGARLLDGLVVAGDGELPVAGAVSSTGAPATVEVLRDELTASVRELSGRFDARNGTPAVSEQVERWLAAPVLPELLLGDVVTRRRARPTAQDRQVPASIGVVDGNPANAAASADENPAGHRPGTAQHRSTNPGKGAQRRPGPDASDPATLPRRWQSALDSGGRAELTEALEAWRRTRGLPIAEQVPALTGARLEAALAISDLDAGTVSLHDARGAARLLHAAGDPAGALLHELACLRREPALGGDPDAVLARAQSLVAMGSQPGGTATAALYVGLVALRQALGLPTAPVVEQGLAALASTDPAGMDAVQRACAALLLRDRAAALPDADRRATLERALALLGPGERVRERALVALALATSLEGSGEHERARDLLAEAADDAAAAGDPGLARHAAHALGRVCHLSGDLPAAVEVFRNLLVELGPDADPLLLAQARQDLAHALHGSGAAVVAAELAETALDDLEDRLAEQGVTSADDFDWVELGETVVEDVQAGADEGVQATARIPLAPLLPLPGGLNQPGGAIQPGDGDGRTAGVAGAAGVATAAGELPAEAELAGTLAFTAALLARDLGEDVVACGLAQRSAAWHRGYGSAEAEAESLELAASVGPDPLEAVGMLDRAATLHAQAGRWIPAATCRRGLTLPLLEVAGLGAAEHALARVQAELRAVQPSDADRHRLAWEQVALADQAARMLASAGQLNRALKASQGLERAFRALGDASSAREVVGLRSRVLEELGRSEECLTELHDAALEARSAGDERQALQLGGYLAAFLDDLGRHDEADTVWVLFTPSPSPLA
jgi:tetratricopeptide (TPR) repeat protein